MRGFDQHPATTADSRGRIAEALAGFAAEAPVRLVVRGICMEPLLVDGQTVEVSAAGRHWPGDVVAFPAESGTLIVHRVIGYRPRGGRLWLQTRADATGTLDPPVDPRRVIGRVAGVRVGTAARARAVVRFARLWLGGFLPR